MSYSGAAPPAMSLTMPLPPKGLAAQKKVTVTLDPLLVAGATLPGAPGASASASGAGGYGSYGHGAGHGCGPSSSSSLMTGAPLPVPAPLPPSAYAVAGPHPDLPFILTLASQEIATAVDAYLETTVTPLVRSAVNIAAGFTMAAHQLQ